MQHIDTIGAAPLRWWLRLLGVVGFVACLNPRPEELPSETDPIPAAAGGTGNSGDYGGSPIDLPTDPSEAPGGVVVEPEEGVQPSGGDQNSGSAGTGGEQALDGGVSPDAGGD